MPAPAQTEAAPAETSEPAAPATDVPAEWSRALEEADDYLDFSAFSKAGLYDQLTSDYGGQYPKEAAQYAVDNVGADWKAEALRAAKEYLDFTPMSKAALHDQLTSEYGSQFTKAEADYAIANLPD